MLEIIFLSIVSFIFLLVSIIGLFYALTFRPASCWHPLVSFKSEE